MAARRLALCSLALLLSCQCAAADDARAWLTVASSKQEAKAHTEKVQQEIGGSTTKAVGLGGKSAKVVLGWWEDYKKYFHKKYNSPAEEAVAFKYFQASLDRVHATNLDDKKTWWASLNQFSDMPYDDVIKKYTSDPAALKKGAERVKRRMLQEGAIFPNGTSLEEGHQSRRLLSSKVDWKAAGKVGPTKWQDKCGGCWAYAAATAIESAYAISKGGKPGRNAPVLSAQQFLDCASQANGYFSMGCSGGTSDDAYLWGTRNGMVQESQYPNVGAETSGSCQTGRLGGRVVKMAKSGGMVTQRSETGLMRAVSSQPVVCYYGVGSDFINYAGGIYEATDCPASANHGLTVYGYDANGGYWLAQNSWGTWWGYSGGLVKLRMTGEGTDGPCLLYTFGAYPSKSFSKSWSGKRMV